jgi:hypothetical protein
VIINHRQSTVSKSYSMAPPVRTLSRPELEKMLKDTIGLTVRLGVINSALRHVKGVCDGDTHSISMVSLHMSVQGHTLLTA